MKIKLCLKEIKDRRNKLTTVKVFRNLEKTKLTALCYLDESFDNFTIINRSLLDKNQLSKKNTVITYISEKIIGSYLITKIKNNKLLKIVIDLNELKKINELYYKTFIDKHEGIRLLKELIDCGELCFFIKKRKNNKYKSTIILDKI